MICGYLFRRLLLLAPDVAGEEAQCTLASQRGGFRVVAGSLLTVETVIGALIRVQDAFRVGGLDLLDVAQRNAFVESTEVIHDRPLRFLRKQIGYPSVIHHRAGHRQIARCQVRDPAPPTIPDDANTPGILDNGDRRPDILERVIDLQLLHVADRLLAILGPVAELDAATDPVEQRRGYRRVAFRREAIGDRANMAVDTENFLQHDDRAAWPGSGRREVGLKLMTVAGHDGGEFAHGMLSKCSRGEYAGYRPGWRKGKARGSSQRCEV
jgi:hypothetical protein